MLIGCEIRVSSVSVSDYKSFTIFDIVLEAFIAGHEDCKYTKIFIRLNAACVRMIRV